MSALTKEILDKAVEFASNNHRLPDVMWVNENALNQIIEWQKREDWFKSLGPHREKLERLRYRLKNRSKHTVMNLPD